MRRRVHRLYESKVARWLLIILLIAFAISGAEIGLGIDAGPLVKWVQLGVILVPLLADEWRARFRPAKS